MHRTLLSLAIYAIFLIFISAQVADIGHDHEHEPGQRGAEKFYKLAKSFEPVSDKVWKHKYHIMYGRFLVPKAEYHKRPGAPKIKFLEIGLGCNMDYGPGASVQIWKALFGDGADIWEADYDFACVEKAKKEGKLEGIHVVTGDQENKTVVAGWVKETGGQFDIVIDDGGHTNGQIMNSFEILWPHVKPGGMYFIEDMEACHSEHGEDGPVYEEVPDVIKGWIDQLLLTPNRGRWPKFRPVLPNPYVGKNTKYKMPEKIESIACSLGVCVLIKCGEENYCSFE